jgi:hypothetical protein
MFTIVWSNKDIFENFTNNSSTNKTSSWKHWMSHSRMWIISILFSSILKLNYQCSYQIIINRFPSNQFSSCLNVPTSILQFAQQYDKLNSHESSLERKTTHVFKSLCLTSFLQFQFCSCLNVATNCLPMCKTTSKIKFTSIKFEKWNHSCSQKYRSYLFLSIELYSCLSGATTYLPIYMTTSKTKFTLIKFEK